MDFANAYSISTAADLASPIVTDGVMSQTQSPVQNLDFNVNPWAFNSWSYQAMLLYSLGYNPKHNCYFGLKHAFQPQKGYCKARRFL